SAILSAIGVASGLRAIAFALGSRNPLVIVWLLAILGFQAITLAMGVRYLLPLLPAILLIVPKVRRGLAVAAVAVSLAVTIPVAIAERAAANCYRDFVARMPVRHFYFAGHWGVQYYAASRGGTLIDVRQPLDLRSGDVGAIARPSFPSPSRLAVAGG